MKRDCDKCGKPATVHLTEIADGQKIEKHLCEDCAASEGITVKANLPISQLLEDFILQTASREEMADLECDVCGLTFAQFRERGILGCPNDYDAFEPVLRPMIERAQEGAGEHIGKVPRRAGTSQKRQNAILRLRAQLKAAIASEHYEKAAELRDRIQEVEAS
ncbi:MAG TPA: UvrB/UvrC motif-containing protein [Phycisphaerae bacterium]|nr:UvrB/UvrC motif-containing protein [Phycisphaerae bacterium]